MAWAWAQEKAERPLQDEGVRLSATIRDQILQTGIPKEAEMGDYSGAIPKIGVKYEMVAISGGEFVMGSPESEANRKEDEGPQRKLGIEPFWMGKYEITWDQFRPFMITDIARRRTGRPENIPADADVPFVVSKPTAPYLEMSLGMGIEGYPAISMTQHSASKFCQWLSAQTGHYYRLPTEAEWEYACRAGTTTAYHFGDDSTKVGEYAWYWDNSGDKYQKVGTKKANPWGLHDMHGNVLEWCLDQYLKDAYKTGQPTIPATKLYPRVVRGGSWYDDADALRSARRDASNPDWKREDPMLPKSLWYHATAPWLGFRIVRPLRIPSAKEMHDLWNSGNIDETGDEN